jgi:hypothetical protein
LAPRDPHLPFGIVLLSMAGMACGGAVAPEPADASSADAGSAGDAIVPRDSAPDAGNLVACADACRAATADNCPVLLLYGCLSGPCGGPAATEICGGGNGQTSASVSTITCVQAALATCPGTCQHDTNCMTFVACLRACGP